MSYVQYCTRDGRPVNPECEAEREIMHEHEHEICARRTPEGFAAWICTRQRGHSGAHVAGLPDGIVLARWRD